MSNRRDYTHRLIEEFRANGGTLGGPFAHTPLLVLTTTGARSGQPHATLLGYLRDGERLIVIAAKQSASRHPDWYHNLVKHPQVTVEIGTETFDSYARCRLHPVCG
jgi:deazaflavin-dependent oxidoreductase (nitroreductase family)